MRMFTPFSIKHLQLDQLNGLKLTPENQYLVFWWKNVPLGNLWIHHNEMLDPFALKLKVQEAVQGAVDFYSLTYRNAEEVAWKKYLLEGNDQKLGEVLNQTIPSSFGASKDAESLSVVICTRNRPEAIVKCVTSLMESIDLDFELIVVDNAPDDNSTELALKIFPLLKYIKEPCKGLDIARNTGARYASRSIIAYTDDDVLVDKNWTKNLKTAFNDPLTMSVTGLVIPVSLQTKSQYIFERDWGFNKGYLPVVFDQKYFNRNVDIGVPVWDIGAGANMAFRREIFDQVGWFDERLDVGASGCSGDSEFWYRILAGGWNCNYYPQVFVYHQHRETAKALKSQIFNYMRGQVSSLLVQHEKYQHKGNLFRAYKSLPIYYTKKILKSIIKLRYNALSDNFNQAKGCISGWLYYNGHRNVVRNGSLSYLKKLDGEVTVNENTKVSVIIPCYNHGHYVEQAIDSVLNQTYKNVEVIVINDGSTDNTSAICGKYTNVKHIATNRLGLSGARNMGAKYSTGDFLVFLDADDFLYPNAIDINLWFFSNNKNCVFVSGAHDKIDRHGNLLPVEKHLSKTENNYESLLQGNYIAMEGTVMYRRELFHSFFFDPQLKACEDYDVNLKITRHFPSLTHNEKIAAYRIHDHNMSADESLMLKNVIRVLKRQETFLRDSKEIEAYQKGLKNWESYYSSK